MRIKKALFIANEPSMSQGIPRIGGGDVRWIEIARKWQEMGIEIHVLTQDAGIELSKRLGLDAIFHNIHASSEYSIKGYINRAFQSFKLPPELEKFEGIIYAVTEHWYDVIPGALIKRKNPESKFAIAAHWVAPLRRTGTSLVNSILFYINQRIGYLVGKKYADVFLAVSESTGEDLKKIGIPESKIRVVEAGVDYKKIRDIALNTKTKDFDGVFMKRFDGTKGVFDVIEIWKYVVSEIPDAKLILIGHGTEKALNKLNSMITSLGLEGNVQILGPIYNFRKKFETLARARLFLLPSYEENWAIVIGEALATGLPVICYDIKEIRPVWKDSVIWVPKGDKREFARRVIELLRDDERRMHSSKYGIEFVKRYDWKKIAQTELELILRGARNE